MDGNSNMNCIVAGVKLQEAPHCAVYIISVHFG